MPSYWIKNNKTGKLVSRRRFLNTDSEIKTEAGTLPNPQRNKAEAQVLCKKGESVVKVNITEA